MAFNPSGLHVFASGLFLFYPEWGRPAPATSPYWSLVLKVEISTTKSENRLTAWQYLGPVSKLPWSLHHFSALYKAPTGFFSLETIQEAKKKSKIKAFRAADKKNKTVDTSKCQHHGHDWSFRLEFPTRWNLVRSGMSYFHLLNCSLQKMWRSLLVGFPTDGAATIPQRSHT